MKLQGSTQALLPKLSTSLLAVSIFVLVACNNSTATAEQAPKETQETIQQAEKIAVPKLVKADNDTEGKIILADASSKTVAKKPPAKKFIEGKHYFEIFPEMHTDTAAGKVEVVELMWLGCPHCYHLEDDVEKYKKNKPDYVDFKQVPAMLNPVWAKDAATFYIANMLDPTGKKQLINKVFYAIHEQGRRLKDEGSVKRYFSQLGISEAAYNGVKNSMAYKAKLSRAKQISAGSQATSVPSIIINGKYRTSPYTAGSESDLFELINMLTEKEKK
ncbi:MAG TPA: thiol:disulfide interchange protein DsbA/DsbL [Leucothrix mucor]|nr:thiol:disulfide interchange protein DsbA/DsbL [Leucothrix mucor]